MGSKGHNPIFTRTIAVARAALVIALAYPASLQAKVIEDCQALLLADGLEQKNGGLITLAADSPAIVQGSLGKTRGVGTTGGIQPDYWVSPTDDPDLKEFLETVESRAMQLPAGATTSDTLKLVHTLLRERLPEKSPVAPQYLELLAHHRSQKLLVPLGKYLCIGAGVCREFALLTHLALKRLGLAARYAYMQHIFQGRVEDHAINLLEIDGRTTVIDFYYDAYHLKPLQELLDSRTLLRINPYPKVWQGPRQVPKSAELIERFKDSPLEVEKQIRGRWWDAKEAARLAGNLQYDDLSFGIPELKPTVDRALEELRTRALLTPALEEQARALADAGYPYRGVLNFILRWIEILEPFASKEYLASGRGPWVSSYFKRGFAQEFEDIALNAPEGLVFPWATPENGTTVDMDFFIRSRATRLYLLGLRTSVTRTDGDPLGPSDFFFHDLEHAFRQKLQTYAIIRGFERPERAALQALWDRRVQNLLIERDRLASEDPELGLAWTYLLFELMHERGFAPDYQSLRDQTLSPRWTIVIERKLKNSFWFPEVRLSPSFEKLEHARKQLNAFVHQQAIAETDWLRVQLLKGARPFSAQATVRIQKPARWAMGRVAALELEDLSQVTVALEVPGTRKLKRFVEPDVGLEQVVFEMPRRFTPEMGRIYGYALALKRDTKVRAVRVHAQTGLPEIYVPEQGWSTLLAVPAGASEPITPLSAHILYRLEQLFHLLQSRGTTDALVLSTPEVFRGTLDAAQGSAKNYTLEMQLPDGQRMRFQPQDAQVVVPDGL